MTDTSAPSVMKMTELSQGTYTVSHVKSIDTPYGKSWVMVLSDDKGAVFANSAVKRLITDEGPTPGLSLIHRGLKTFTRKLDKKDVTYADVALNRDDIQIQIDV